MLKINRLNKKGHEVECLIVVDNIDGVTEKEQEQTNLYDENGNIVETRDNESLYKIHFTSGAEIYVTKATYDKLVAKIKPETL
jgi:uncharacterized protein RhaS with RHS repeats